MTYTTRQTQYDVEIQKHNARLKAKAYIVFLLSLLITISPLLLL